MPINCSFMKIETIRNFMLVFYFLTISSLASSHVVVTGNILNSKSQYVNLTYMGSCSVPSPNYYGDKRICTPIVDKGFKFNFNSDPEYSLFLLEFEKDRESIKILLKDGDSIHIFEDFNNKINTFIASGKGSSLTNYLFAESIIWPSTIPAMNTEEIIPFWKNVQTDELSLIETFKSKTLKNLMCKYNDEIIGLTRLLIGSKLIPLEYKLLENRTYYYIATSIARTPFDYLINNLDRYLSLFADIDLSKDFILNDYASDDLVGCYVSLSCYKEFIDKTGSHNIDSIRAYSSKNFFRTAIKLLRGRTLEKFLCDNIYNSMLAGNYSRYDNLYTQNKDVITNKYYLRKIEDFHSNYLTSLNNPDFKLGLPDRVLNDSTVFKLLNSLRGHKVYLTIWKVGSGMSYPLSPLYDIQTIKEIYKLYEPKGIRFLDICLDDGTLKQHWASSIVNSDWHGEHYFYVGSDSSKFRQMFGIVGSLKSCNGELYYLLDESGKIAINNRSDLILVIE
jgi:hypothetical protein